MCPTLAKRKTTKEKKHSTQVTTPVQATPATTPLNDQRRSAQHDEECRQTTPSAPAPPLYDQGTPPHRTGAYPTACPPPIATEYHAHHSRQFAISMPSPEGYLRPSCSPPHESAGPVPEPIPPLTILNTYFVVSNFIM